jgi:hypothetical protein
MTCQK